MTSLNEPNDHTKQSSAPATSTALQPSSFKGTELDLPTEVPEQKGDTPSVSQQPSTGTVFSPAFHSWAQERRWLDPYHDGTTGYGAFPNTAGSGLYECVKPLRETERFEERVELEEKRVNFEERVKFELSNAGLSEGERRQKTLRKGYTAAMSLFHGDEEQQARTKQEYSGYGLDCSALKTSASELDCMSHVFFSYHSSTTDPS